MKCLLPIVPCTFIKKWRSKQKHVQPRRAHALLTFLLHICNDCNELLCCCKDNICITQLTDKSNHVKHLQSSPKSCKRKDKLKQVVRSINHMLAKQQVYDDTQNSTQNIQHLTNNSNNEETKATSKSANHQSTAEHLNSTETCSSDNFSTFGLTKKGLRIGNLNVSFSTKIR